jgi:UDP-GlcNAc:undecaprenyl-phosphate GlcNAc-1-phosphate transferase
MQIELNLNFFFIFSLISFLTTFLMAKYSKRLLSGSLLDNDFSKPQAFHKTPVARAGGLAILFLFTLFILFYFFSTDIFLKDYFTISLFLFFLGFLDDLKIKINPNMRLFLMIFILTICMSIFSIQINKTGLEFLNLWLENNIFQTCFVLLCFLFIVNGANLIDGYNGLLAIHFLIINFILLIINLNNQNYDISLILISQIIIVFSFLFFNFPQAKIFLGDAGSYLCGSLIVVNTIKTHQLNLDISPFFYASILFYLFFEVFFSFVRKVIKKKSPLRPDNLHLHMLLYNFFLKSKNYVNSNYKTALSINLVYFILILPVFYFQNNAIFSRYYFFFLITLYIYIYYFLLRKKNENF